MWRGVPPVSLRAGALVAAGRVGAGAHTSRWGVGGGQLPPPLVLALVDVGAAPPVGLQPGVAILASIDYSGSL